MSIFCKNITSLICYFAHILECSPFLLFFGWNLITLRPLHKIKIMFTGIEGSKKFRFKKKNLLLTTKMHVCGMRQYRILFFIKLKLLKRERCVHYGL